MQKHRRLIELRQLLDEDLETICTDLTAEFGKMSGGRLLVTGGGGFLGYYLVQSVLHWNDTRPAQRKIDIVVYDNYVRGLPEWLEALRHRPDLQLRRQDLIEPLPQDIGHFDWIVHAAGIASPIYYRARPLKCVDANINGLRNLLDYAVAEREKGNPLSG
jgi:dTDP-glucose 4,6-dehydratase/UDP-glucuronate decarboxylase